MILRFTKRCLGYVYANPFKNKFIRGLYFFILACFTFLLVLVASLSLFFVPLGAFKGEIESVVASSLQKADPELTVSYNHMYLKLNLFRFKYTVAVDQLTVSKNNLTVVLKDFAVEGSLAEINNLNRAIESIRVRSGLLVGQAIESGAGSANLESVDIESLFGVVKQFLSNLNVPNLLINEFEVKYADALDVVLALAFQKSPTPLLKLVISPKTSNYFFYSDIYFTDESSIYGNYGLFLNKNNASISYFLGADIDYLFNYFNNNNWIYNFSALLDASGNELNFKWLTVNHLNYSKEGEPSLYINPHLWFLKLTTDDERMRLLSDLANIRESTTYLNLTTNFKSINVHNLLHYGKNWNVNLGANFNIQTLTSAMQGVFNFTNNDTIYSRQISIQGQVNNNAIYNSIVLSPIDDKRNNLNVLVESAIELSKLTVDNTIRVNKPSFTIQELLATLPKTLLENLYNWLNDNIKQAEFSDFVIQIKSDFLSDSKEANSSIALNFKANKANLTYFGELDSIRNASGEGFIRNQQFQFNFTGGAIRNIQLAGGYFLIQNVLSDDLMSEVVLRTKADIQDIFAIINKPPLQIVSSKAIDTRIKTVLDVDFTLRFPLDTNASYDSVDFFGSARSRYFESDIGGVSAKGNNLQLTINKERLLVEGLADFKRQWFKIDYEQYFDSTKHNNQSMQLKLQTIFDNSLSYKTIWGIVYMALGENHTQIDLWGKESFTEGKLSVETGVKNRWVDSLPKVTFEPNFTIPFKLNKGYVEVDYKGGNNSLIQAKYHLGSASFEQFVVNNLNIAGNQGLSIQMNIIENDDLNSKLWQQQEPIYNWEISGNSLDLKPFVQLFFYNDPYKHKSNQELTLKSKELTRFSATQFKTATLKEVKAVSYLVPIKNRVVIHANRMLMEKGVELTHSNGYMDISDYNLENLVFKAKLKESFQDIKMNFVSNNRLMQEKYIDIEIQDIAGLLNGLNFNLESRGGSAELQGLMYVSKDYLPIMDRNLASLKDMRFKWLSSLQVKNESGEANKQEFKELSRAQDSKLDKDYFVVEKIFTQVSLQNNIVFFEKANGKIDNFRFLIEGKVDFSTANIGFTGVGVPDFILNQAIAFIPIVGYILTGRNEGLFLNMRFDINGTVTQPELKMNYLSAVTVGVLQDFVFALNTTSLRDK